MLIGEWARVRECARPKMGRLNRRGHVEEGGGGTLAAQCLQGFSQRWGEERLEGWVKGGFLKNNTPRGDRTQRVSMVPSPPPGD